MEAAKPIYKVHASGAGAIMAGSLGLSEAQEKTLFELVNKPKARTELQEKTMQELMHKKANPELPEGAKTQCKIWIKQNIYARRKEFTSKYTERGDISELATLDFTAKFLGLPGCPKNDQFFENDWFVGTPDSLPDGQDLVIDAKSPWDCFTFPLFDDVLPEKDYFAQAQVYMDLTERSSAIFSYVLNDTPENIIVQEAKNWCFRNGEQFRPEVVEEMRERLTYKNIDDRYKIKVFRIERDDIYIHEMRKRVEMCREFIENFLKNPLFQPLPQTA